MLAELPIDIISLPSCFYEQEAADYMEDTHEFLWQAVSKKEKYLHLSEVSRRSLQFDNSMSIPSQVASILRVILRTHRPDFRYAGNIEDEIQQAYYIAKPYELSVLKVIFKITGSPVYDRLKDLPSTVVYSWRF